MIFLHLGIGLHNDYFSKCFGYVFSFICLLLNFDEDDVNGVLFTEISSQQIFFWITTLRRSLIADFGLAKLSLKLDIQTHVSTRVMGTFRYVLALEYASSGKLTEKYDVYSFGVVILELITSRRPIDAAQPLDNESLVERVFGTLVIAKLLSIPTVMSYHTHILPYIPRYTFSWLVKPMWLILEFLHRAAILHWCPLLPLEGISKQLRATLPVSILRKSISVTNIQPKIFAVVAKFKPHIIHASSRGIMVFAALVIAKLLLISYHAHIPVYVQSHVKFLHRAVDLPLVPSIAIGRDLEAAERF
ncbi:hypothetical protein OROMI_004309 [Orobanche minor]